MKSLVIYDSAYGNTAKIAHAISASLQGYGTSDVKLIEEVSDDEVKAADLIVIGSPTQAGRPTNSAQQFVSELLAEPFKNKKIALFDTRFEAHDQSVGLRILMKTIGYAAPKMARTAQRKGLHVISEPIGFIVTDTKGPLKDGEAERAAAWATQLAQTSVSP